MPALLYCRTGPMSGASFSLDAETTVGRTGEHAVTLSDERISSRHARLWPDRDSGEWMLQDLESRNGTLVDGSPAAEPVRLGDLSVITFAGRFDFIFQVVKSSSPPKKRPSKDRAPSGDDDVHTRIGGAAPSLPDVDPSAEGVRTRFGGEAPALPDVNGDGDDVGNDEGTQPGAGDAPPDLPDVDDMRTRIAGAAPGLPDVSSPESEAKPETFTLHLDTSEMDTSLTDVSTFVLNPGKHVVGRSADSDIRIDDASLSRSHAVITVDGGRVSIRDNGSKNGTYIDGEKVTDDRTISPENRLRFGFRIEAWISSDQSR